MNFKRFHESKNLFDVSTVEKGRIDNGEVVNVSQTSSLTIEGGTVSFTTTATYRGVCSGFFEIPEGTETITFNFIRNEALGVKFVFYDSTKTWLNQDYSPNLLNIPPATANVPSGAKYVRLSFTGQITGGYSYTMSNIMLNLGSTPLPYEPYGDTWLNSHYIMETSTDTITTLPAVIYANDTTATVGIKGNMSQTGTPTPTNPIYPSECGEMTGNLFDKNATDTSNGYVRGKYLKSTGEETVTSNYSISEYIDISIYSKMTLSGFIDGANSPSLCFYDINHDYISGISYNGRFTVTFDVPSQAKYIRFTYAYIRIDTAMLNTGSTAKPFEPYGYKIPISSANTTTPVYLGEVQTTRQIKKLVLTGEETWYSSGTYTGAVYAYHSQFPGIKPLTPIFCTHLVDAYGTQYVQGTCNNDSNSVGMWVFDTTTSPSAFKTYLAQQYAAGTPVTVWYVLATPTTGIVNEPIRKIGDYADTVSGISIPTIAGADTLSVGTTLQPSEVTVNYHGWHPAQSVHERESGQWD